MDIVANFKTAVSDDYEECYKAVDSERMALVLERSVAKEMGFKIKLAEDVKIQNIIPRSKYVDIMYEVMKQIPKKLVEEIVVIGTCDDCINKIEKYLKAGATSISISNCGPDIEKTYEIYKDKIIPYFKETYGLCL
jgi:imidazole glycerol phosphate synthase subunit HisF